MQGRLHLVFGETGAGKSWHCRNRLLRSYLSPRGLCIMYSPEGDDPLEFGPDLTMRELRLASQRGLPMPQAFALREATHRDAIQVALTALDRFRPVVLMLDELHEAFPSQGGQSLYDVAERRALRACASLLFNRKRHRPLVLLGASQKYTAVLPVVRETADQIDFFRLTEVGAVKSIEERYGAQAALEVSTLAPHAFVPVPRGQIPARWRGNEVRLRRKIAREVGR